MNIVKDFIPKGRKNAPGYKLVPQYITIHDTGNSSKGANAEMHSKYLKGDAAAARPASWHYTVDEFGAYQHLPINEVGWHAGDGTNGPGNRTSIGIEICQNVDGDRQKAEANAAILVAMLLKETGLPISRVVQHSHWSGKNCPAIIRNSGWDKFIQRIADEMKKSDPLPEEPGGTGTFKDVPDNHWARASIEKAVKTGIMVGVAPGIFGPGEPLTREQFVSVLDRLGLLD